jgi:hypothetical protein
MKKEAAMKRGPRFRAGLQAGILVGLVVVGGPLAGLAARLLDRALPGGACLIAPLAALGVAAPIITRRLGGRPWEAFPALLLYAAFLCWAGWSRDGLSPGPPDASDRLWSVLSSAALLAGGIVSALAISRRKAQSSSSPPAPPSP